jgi:hypothetical protein
MSQHKKVIYRGVSMIEGWPDKIVEAQSILTCEVRGKQVPRIRYGEEEDDWGADKRPCHDCGVFKGELHVEGCDVERCPGCGGQRFNCDCEPYEDEDEDDA